LAMICCSVDMINPASRSRNAYNRNAGYIW